MPRKEEQGVEERRVSGEEERTFSEISLRQYWHFVLCLIIESLVIHP
jgi:hypothetical protein